ncbi:energy transducer TonB [Sphingomonas crusticola]|uniref:energy transducer TonB n=1 Tax=Sphingomonas crusticola TaxID=1697973 RepID=UPI000E25B4B9|nr:energy transducer TonB [Sphingomonas crusticola]
MLMIMALQAAVAFAHPPQRLSDSGRITFEDYPAKAMKRGETGIVSAVLHIGPDGRVDRCAVTESSKSVSLDSATCTLAQTRSRFEPARDADGKAIAGEYRLAMTWTMEQNQPRARIYAKTRVAALPPGYVQPVSLMVVFGQDGRALECEIMASSGNGQTDAAVCGSVTQSLVIKAPKTASAEPAAGVRYYIMSLIPDQGTEGAAKH